MVEHDAFRDRAAEGIGYVADHKSQVYKYVGAGLLLFLLIAGFLYYRSYQQEQRQQALYEGLRTYNAIVAENPPPFADKFFKTASEKNDALRKELTQIAEKYDGTSEAAVARYYLGVHYADSANTAESEKNFKIASETGDKSYQSLAKISLAQLYRSQGKMSEAETLARWLVANPSPFFSKEHATIELARIIGQSKPEEARKLLEPLRTARPAVSQSALTALSDMMQKK